MEERFKVRFEQLLAEAKVDTKAVEGALERLVQFVEPFADTLTHDVRKQHLMEYVAGSMSNISRKSVEAIAYMHKQDRQLLQKFIGQKEWDERPMIDILVKQVGETIGRPNGVLVFDPSGVRKQGKKSVGTARQYCGRIGKVDNCQVAVYLAYVSGEEHVAVDTPLKEFARVLDAEHRIEECFRRAKSESGMGSYQVRNWLGWHHHQALTLIATWFLTQEKVGL